MSDRVIQVREAAIDPKKWLMNHLAGVAHGLPQPSGLAMGQEAIEACGGCVVSAMIGAPDLRAEIVMAYLLADRSINESTKSRIMSLADAVGAT